MKRGWITWDKTELPPSVFDARLAVVRKELAARDLPALVVYTDVWRSNQGRYLANLMPYWNRALLVIPRDGAPILLCGLSPRVYPWIRSVTILEDVRPNLNVAKLREENGWDRIGVLDLPLLPNDLAIPDSVDVPWSAIHPQPDEAELAMYRRAAKLAREILEAELPGAAGLVDHEFVARLELKYRRAGIEDLVVLTTNGSTPPLPPNGSTLSSTCAVSVAMEYRGHWVKIVRSLVPAGIPTDKAELLSGPYPYEGCSVGDLPPGAIFAVTSARYGETYQLTTKGAIPL
jgi:hypothetical protein